MVQQLGNPMYLNLRKIKKLRRNGFTLIEIMVAMVLASLLAIGMQSFLAMLGEETQDFVLRQKAIFILNGEMEKLNYLTKNGTWDINNGVSVSFSDYAGVVPPHFNFTSSHMILPDSLGTGPLADFTTSNPALFDETDAATNKPKNEHLVYYYEPNGEPKRNVVWLDFEKKITARLSYVAVPFDASCNVATTIANCYLLTVYLDYPFRFENPPTGNPITPMEGRRINSLSLRTITGQWKQ